MVYRQVIVLNKRTFLALFFTFYLFSIPIFAEEWPAVSAHSAVLYDGLSGEILYGKAENTTMGMASTTKIMTALVALEQYDLERPVSVRKEWAGIEGSSMYLKPGEQLTVMDLLYGLLLASGNDAATALAGLHPEGEAGFVAEMNRTARDLGLENTHFENPSGLDGEAHYTTAYELAVLAAYAMENERFAEIVSTQTIQVAGRWLKNHNRLLAELDACGVKTGFTKRCGRCLVSAKEQNGRMLICVTLKAPDDWNDHKALYDYGFSLFQWREITGAGDCGSVSVVSADRQAIRLYTAESYSVWAQKSEADRIRITLCGPRFWYGSAEPGQQYGTLQVWLDQLLLFETPVYFAEQAREVPVYRFWEKLIFYLLGDKS